MPDVWTAVPEMDAEVQEQLAQVLETRGKSPQQQEMRRAFLAQLELEQGSQVLDVGCGTGVLTRMLAELDGIEKVVGADLAPSLIERARELAAGVGEISYCEADACELPFADESWDAVTFDSTLSHLPEPQRALAEAIRVLKPGGVMAVFDGDYATATVALGDLDPLQACVSSMMRGSVTDRFVVRRLPALARASGLQILSFKSHGFAEAGESDYILTVIDRGADSLGAAGLAGEDLVAALKGEARRRISSGEFFGHIAYASLVARKPG